MVGSQFRCPVCGHLLDTPPENFTICVRCGTEFGLDDVDVSHAELRSQWEAKGKPWFFKS